MTDNQPVPDKYFTSQAIAICCPDLRGNSWFTSCTVKCIGGIVCQLVILKRRTQLANALPGVFVRIFCAVRIILWWFHENSLQIELVHEWNNILPRQDPQKMVWNYEMLFHCDYFWKKILIIPAFFFDCSRPLLPFMVFPERDVLEWWHDDIHVLHCHRMYGIRVFAYQEKWRDPWLEKRLKKISGG